MGNPAPVRLVATVDTPPTVVIDNVTALDVCNLLDTFTLYLNDLFSNFLNSSTYFIRLSIGVIYINIYMSAFNEEYEIEDMGNEEAPHSS